MVPGSDIAIARLLAEGLRAALSEGQVDGIPVGVGPVTASFGVATLDSGEGLEALFGRADAALYQAKREGRNCVRQAERVGVAANEDHSRTGSDVRPALSADGTPALPLRPVSRARLKGCSMQGLGRTPTSRRALELSVRYPYCLAVSFCVLTSRYVTNSLGDR